LGFPPASRLLSPSFDFRPGELPLTSYTASIAAVVTYVAGVFMLKAVWRSRRAVSARENHPWAGTLDAFAYWHNMFLSALSVAMLCGIAYETYQHAHGVSSLFCDEEHVMNRGRVMWWYYIFYLSKFYELLDTFIIVLKKNPVIFLHWYHHFITLILVQVSLRASLVVLWAPIAANACVHVFMYYYYALLARGHPADRDFCSRYKVFITRLQISQFVFDLCVIFYSFNLYLRNPKCDGSTMSYIFTIVVLSSFLLLFLNFYFKRYTGKKPQDSAEKPTAAKNKKQQ